MENIKIGGIDYKVVYKEIPSDDGVQLGWCDYAKATLEINNHNVSKQVQEQTVIHEMTHAIIQQAGLGFGEDDERVTNHIALILHQVLKDNDFSWVRKEDLQITFDSINVAEEMSIAQNGKLMLGGDDHGQS